MTTWSEITSSRWATTLIGALPPMSWKGPVSTRPFLVTNHCSFHVIRESWLATTTSSAV